MLIGSKYEEIYAPEVKDFVYISDKAYTWDEIMKMESLMRMMHQITCSFTSRKKTTPAGRSRGWRYRCGS